MSDVEERPHFWIAVPEMCFVIARSGVRFTEPEEARAMEACLVDLTYPEWTGPSRPPFLDSHVELKAQLAELRLAMVTMGWVK